MKGSAGESIRAFTLLEALLAMLVFSLAVIALVEAINRMGLAAVESQMEAAVQSRLDDHLLLTTRKLGAVVPGTALHEERRAITEDRVTYTIVVKSEEVRNLRGIRLADLYRVKVTASWMDDGRPQEKSVESLVWPPLHAAVSYQGGIAP
jgi:hypothetical protein